MELGHLLTRSGLTYPEVSSKVCHDSSCQLGNSVSLPWVINLKITGILNNVFKPPNPTPLKKTRIKLYNILDLPVLLHGGETWTITADSHITCRAHAVPLPCRAAKGLECLPFDLHSAAVSDSHLPCRAHAML